MIYQKEITDPIKLKQKLVHFLKYRERSAQESRSYLNRYSKNQVIIDQIIDEFVELKLINDADFAQWLVKSRVNSFRGRIFIQQELSKFGIDPSISKEILSKYDSKVFVDAALQLLEAKAAKYSNYESLERKQKLMALLYRRGFTQEVITIAIDSYLSGE